MGGEELKWHQLAHYHLMSLQGPHCLHRKAKAIDKRPNLRKNLSSGISHIAFASVYSEKTRLKKCWIMIIIIMNKSQETTVFYKRQKLTSAMKQRPEKL